MKIATIARSLPGTGSGTSSQQSPQVKKSKEAITAYSAKFQDFSRDCKQFVKLLEDAKKANMKNEAVYHQIVAQTNAWTSNLESTTLNKEEIATLEMTLREDLVEYEKDYEEEVLSQARKFKVGMVKELQTTLKNARDAWAGVKHYESKVNSLSKKLNRLSGSERPVETVEDKLDRNEKKLLQSITIAHQWDEELKRSGKRVDQSWITVMSIIKDFTDFEARTAGKVSKIKNKIEELVDEDTAYALDQKAQESIVMEESERPFPVKSFSTFSGAATAASAEMSSFKLPSFKKKNKSKSNLMEQSLATSKSEDPTLEDDDILEFDQVNTSVFRKFETKKKEPTESSFYEEEGSSQPESEEEPFDEKVAEDSDDECYLSEPQEEDDITV